MEKPAFDGDDNIPLVTQRDEDRERDHDNDYDDYNAPSSSKVDVSLRHLQTISISFTA